MLTFGNVPAAYFLLLIIPLLFFLGRGYKKARKSAETFAQPDLLAELLPADQKRIRVLKRLFLVGALVFCILALMRPRTGPEADNGGQSGLDLIIAIDVSRSMLAADVQPNRLEFSKRLVREFLPALRGDRVGLVAFSGSAFLLCPLTADYQAVRFVLDTIDQNVIPRGGTSLAQAIDESLKGFRPRREGARVILLLTDGEDHEGNLLQAADAARKEGVPIFTLGIGTVAGELIPVKTEDGRGGFLKDRQGNVVRSRLDEAALKHIAGRTGGGYLQASEAGEGWRRLAEEKIGKLERHKTPGPGKQNYQEWFQIPLGMALLLIVSEAIIAHRKKGR